MEENFGNPDNPKILRNPDRLIHTEEDKHAEQKLGERLSKEQKQEQEQKHMKSMETFHNILNKSKDIAAKQKQEQEHEDRMKTFNKIIGTAENIAAKRGSIPKGIKPKEK